MSFSPAIAILINNNESGSENEQENLNYREERLFLRDRYDIYNISEKK